MSTSRRGFLGLFGAIAASPALAKLPKSEPVELVAAEIHKEYADNLGLGECTVSMFVMMQYEGMPPRVWSASDDAADDWDDE